MTRDELRTKLGEWVGEILESDAPTLEDGMDLVADVGLDSLGMAELAAKTRFLLGIKIRPRDLAGDHHVGFLLDLVEARLAEASGPSTSDT